MAMIGRTLTHYKVVEELGVGGMGVVYKALDLRLDRHVALKILPPGKSDDAERRSRFLHEARAASALNDPHIVTIFDIFTDEGTDVLVMEFVQGRTLRDILNDGPMAIAKAIDIASQVAEGVGTAHAAGIVHRDLKPGNVMVTDRGRVKVLDFGLAKLVGGSFADQATVMAPTTVAGMLLGTVDYMSPEQARGDPIDARSDVFSLGAMLYEMLTGTRPFVGSHPVAVLHEILYGAPLRPRSKRPELSPEIEAVVLSALERDHAQRCPSMDSFASELRRAQQQLDAGVPVAAPVPPTVPPPLPPHSPKPVTVTDPAAAPSASPSMPEPITLSGAWHPGTLPRERRPALVRKGRRSRWVTFVVVASVITTCNWVRNSMEPPTRAPRPRVARPVVPGDNSTGDRIGAAVEDTVADVLESVGQNSAALQLARGKIYWERAKKNGDAALTQKAEDAFKQVLRLDPDDDEAEEAREALREIAESKEAQSPR
jgi:serine/threonine protein kinase